MERIVIGMLAHVDAGKTTLSEALLFRSGTLRRLGRVDHRDAFLDTHEIERERGITVFSKQAELEYGGKSFTLIDTPGHTDFSAEAERTVQVLDCAVLVVSAPEGVTAHTVTLWQLLKKRGVPVFVFVNKTDLPSPSRAEMIRSLDARLGEGFVDFNSERAERDENVASLSESMTDEFIEKGLLSDGTITEAVRRRLVYPVFFGSALKLEGVDELLSGLADYTKMPDYPEKFGARVYKIAHLDGQRLTFMKITGGTLAAKQMLTNRSATVPEDAVWEEKADQLRLYSGAKFTPIQEAPAGTVCAVTGLTRTEAGEGLGIEAGFIGQELRPVLSYSLIFNDNTNLFDAYRRIITLQEEDPQLNIVWDEEHKEILAELMGEVQCEVLKRLIMERFGLDVGFDAGSVMYRETVNNTVNGIGHFEPLRHFAHVELRVEPLPAGSGFEFASEVSQNELSRNWQRLILTHLAEKKHRGVLTGSPLTDVRIILTGGKAHLKHTEGGDFRQATYRAVRNALMFAESVLLEPYYSFRLELPEECVGRAMTDIRRMNGEFSAPEGFGEHTVISGFAPVSTMRDYGKTVAAYTKGRGLLSLEPADYRECHNAEEVVAAKGYDPEADLRNSPDSVFCAAGAGFTVKWYDVASYMKKYSGSPNEKMPTKKPVFTDPDEELKAIFERTYGKVEGTKLLPRRRETELRAETAHTNADEYLLIDGYNVIFAWESLSALARESIDLARETLIRMMINFSGGRRGINILVFDAWKVTGGVEKVEKDGGVYVVYTRESEIADVFIERAVEKLKNSERSIRVVSSDGMEQLIVMGRGALRVPASAFEKEVELSSDRMKEIMKKLEREGKTVVNIGEKMNES